MISVAGWGLRRYLAYLFHNPQQICPSSATESSSRMSASEALNGVLFMARDRPSHSRLPLQELWDEALSVILHEGAADPNSFIRFFPHTAWAFYLAAVASMTTWDFSGEVSEKVIKTLRSLLSSGADLDVRIPITNDFTLDCYGTRFEIRNIEWEEIALAECISLDEWPSRCTRLPSTTRTILSNMVAEERQKRSAMSAPKQSSSRFWKRLRK